MELFDSEELRINEALEKAKKAVSSFGIVRNLSEQKLKQDYPQFKIFHGQFSKINLFSDGIFYDTNSTGVGTDPDMAMLKVLSETFERYSATIYKNEKLIKGAFSELKQKALNPKDVVAFSKKQLRNDAFEIYRVDENAVFRWIEGISLISGEKVLVPAQLVYWNYQYGGEPIIHISLSTGVAGGTSYAGATLRGIFEVVEREGFIITWLNKLPRKEVDLTDASGELRNILEEFKKYKFEVRVFDSSTDVRIHSFFSILIDRSNHPIIGCGLKAGLDPEETIKGAIEESFHSMPWRREIFNRYPNKKIKPEAVSSFEDRIIYWNQKGMIKELDFLLKNKNKVKISEFQNYSTGSCLKDLEFVKEELKNKGLETIVVDITPRDVAQIGFKEVKVLIPKMHPLYLKEKYKYLGGSRLYEIPKSLGFKEKEEGELNKTPHPFL